MTGDSTGVDAVLVVDDEPIVRELLAAWLVRAGYRVHEAPDAESAIEMMATLSVSVVFVDQLMPGRGGEWLVTQVREQFPATAVILATGSDVPRRVSLQPGVVGYLSKPFSRETVLRALEDGMIWHHVAARARTKPPSA
jgi:CheY-like chemotaxis protein